MSRSVADRLLRRELRGSINHSSINGIYGDTRWAENLDIVNELDAHSGCVNALSWSSSGRLLASGSDDTHLNIHTYLPESSTSQFSLTTSIATGHTQNIFSVKFMPHSGDRSLVSVAGDGDVRIFDVEYSSSGQGLSSNDPPIPYGATPAVWANTRRLTYADTNAKVFKSHSQRVKRIVTESSPFFFLTCSEDGEVRQWDLREPESSYPRRLRAGLRSSLDTNKNWRPPLIDYSRYDVDLNTISCSQSRPHYIALGGSHLHCFLHDRRMLGRDRPAERGSPSSPVASAADDTTMNEATRCVRRFAPNGQPVMGKNDNGHITACKISNARPNELIVSWSGDHVYSFDIIDDQNSSGPAEKSARRTNGKDQDAIDRKRKRVKEGSTLSTEASARASGDTPAANELNNRDDEHIALRVNYANGQREDIPISLGIGGNTGLSGGSAHAESYQRSSSRIAGASVRLRKLIFTPATEGTTPMSSSESEGVLKSLDKALEISGRLLADMESIIRGWRYPVNPPQVDLIYQRHLRRNRERGARFVQGAGTLARLLSASKRTHNDTASNLASVAPFAQIRPALNEQYPLEQQEHFGYDFLKAICLWLDSGPGALVRGFTKRGQGARFPIMPSEDEEEPGIDAIDDQLIPYLLRLAGTRPILNIDTNEFERDESRIAFRSEKAAVLAFAQAVKLPFEDLTTGAVLPATSTSAQRAAAQDRSAALRFWAYKIGRGVLINAAAEVDFASVDEAFGGDGEVDESIEAEERALARLSRTITVPLGSDTAPHTRANTADLSIATTYGATLQTDPSNDGSAVQAPAGDEEGIIPIEVLRSLVADDFDTDDEGHERPEIITSEDGDVHVNDEMHDERDFMVASDDEDDSDMEGEEIESAESTESEGDAIRSRFGFPVHRSRRSKAHLDTPVSSQLRSYRGHLNVKTVKDVNYWGLDDEYVVSGSDSGHIFIWDRQTTKLVNILEGDGEVVNVIQGHPYEPMLAVSGIDNTIKIFSPDAQARRNARLGIGVTRVDDGDFSSTHGIQRRRRTVRPRPANPVNLGAQSNLPTTIGEAEAQAAAQRRAWAGEAAEEGSDAEEDGRGGGPRVAESGLASRKRMWDEYRILSSNAENPRGGAGQRDFISRPMMNVLLRRLRQRYILENGETDLAVEALSRIFGD